MPEITMPQLGESITEGTITKWFKQVGDTVAEDEPLFEVSTDKVDSEVPSPASGVLSEIRVAEGETVDVGTVLAVLGDGAAAPAAPVAPAAEAPAAPPTPPSLFGTGAGAAAAPTSAPPVPPAPAPPTFAPLSAPPGPAAAPPPPAPTAAPAPPVAPPTAPAPPSAPPVSAAPEAATEGGAAGRRLLSPLVRRLIEEHGLDADSITGTGLGGRITREDVLAVIDARAAGSAAAPPAAEVPAPPAAPAAPPTASQPAPPPAPTPAAQPTQDLVARPVTPAVRGGVGDTIEPLNNIRRRTAEHMLMSKAVSPHAITAVDVDYENVERARRPVRAQFHDDEGFALTYLPFISRAVVDALADFPHMNASVGDGELIVHHYVNLSIAVDLDFQGLLAPVVKGADGKRLRAIARDIHDLADRARSKKLSPDDLSGGTFTLSNSGSFGTFMVVPIINQPQAGILSVDGVKRRPVVVVLPDGSESIAIHSVGNLTLSWDHRAFDGAYAAAFMGRVKEIIETRDWATEL